MRKMGIPRASDRELKSEKSYTKQTGGSKIGVRTTFEMRLMRVRKNATARERRRLAEVNCAYTELSRQVPQQLLGNATKLEVLRGAAQYIHMLMVMLGKGDIFDYHKKGNSPNFCYVRDLNGQPVTTVGDGRVMPRSDHSAAIVNTAVPQTLTATAPFSFTCLSACSATRTHVIQSTAGTDGDVSSSSDDEGSTCTLKAECSFVQSGVLKLDDPPPKANISWR